MHHNQFFWLHIKKSAGLTTRSLLQPYYIEVDRVNQPKTFIQASTEEYNDIINNYRIMLGEYQFKRCQFAKKYLYPNEWDEMFSFAFSRDPVDRAISMFYYLFWKNYSPYEHLIQILKRYICTRKFIINSSYAFDVFLDYAHEAQSSRSVYYPLGNHFTTHTAMMWNDVVDSDGKILLKKIFRLENLIAGINVVFEECCIDKRLVDQGRKINKNKRRGNYNPSRNQIRKIKEIYQKDFEIYESNCDLHV